MTKNDYNFWIERYEDCLYQIDFYLINELNVLRYYRLLNYIDKRMRSFKVENSFKG